MKAKTRQLSPYPLSFTPPTGTRGSVPVTPSMKTPPVYKSRAIFAREANLLTPYISPQPKLARIRSINCRTDIRTRVIDGLMALPDALQESFHQRLRNINAAGVWPPRAATTTWMDDSYSFTATKPSIIVASPARSVMSATKYLELSVEMPTLVPTAGHSAS
jgi:hypothetical protein